MTNISTLTQAQIMRARILEIQNDLARANVQVATGKKTEAYSGLRSDARTSISLNNAKATVEGYQKTISLTKARVDTMQAIYQRISDITVEVRNTVLQIAGVAATPDGSTSASLKALAENRLKEITSLLNTEIDGRFLFSGLRLGTKPMLDPGAVGTAGTPLDTVATGAPALAATAASGQDRFVAIAGAEDTTTGAAAVAATTIDVAGPPAGVQVGMQVKFEGHATVYTITGIAAGQITIGGAGLTAAVANGESLNYLGYISEDQPALYYQGDATGALVSSRIDDGLDLAYGVRGNDSAFAKIMGALYAVATSDLTTANEAGYREMSRMAMDALDAGFDALQERVGVLGVQQATMEQAAKRHTDFLLILQTQITDIEDVDAAEAYTRVTMLQTNLEASYRLIASTRELSLVNFL